MFRSYGDERNPIHIYISNCSKKSSLRNFETQAETNFSVTNPAFDNFHLQNLNCQRSDPILPLKDFPGKRVVFPGSVGGFILRPCNWGDNNEAEDYKSTCAHTLQDLVVRRHAHVSS